MHRLTVREEEDRSKVREFRKIPSRNGWYCVNSNARRKCTAPAKIKYGILYVPIYHSDACLRKEYSWAMEIQDLLKQGRKTEAWGLVQSNIKKPRSINVSSQYFSTSVPNNTLYLHKHPKNRRKTKTTSIKKPQRQTTFTNSNGTLQLNNGTPRNTTSLFSYSFDASENNNQRTNNDDLESITAETSSTTNLTINESEMDKSNALSADGTVVANAASTSSLTVRGSNSNDGTASFTLNSSNLKRKNNENVSKETVENRENAFSKRPKVEKMEEEDDDILIIEPIDQKPEIHPILFNDPFAVPFPFEIPSPKILKDLCEKLNISYNKQAYQLWLKIDFEIIPTISTNLKLHDLKTKKIFECLSLLFTGEIEQSFPIQYTINGAFRDKLFKAGNMTQKEIDRTFMPSTASDEHLKFIAEFLNCRIDIFKKQELTRFGKWDSESDILTVVLAHFNGCYSVVLNL